MKYGLSTILMSSLLLVGGLCLTACSEDDLVPTPGTSLNGVTLEAFGPCPLTRGGTMEVIGSNLAKVNKVLFPKGNQQLTETKEYEEADFVVNDKGGLTVTVPNEVVPGKLRLVVGNDTLVSTSYITYDEECTVQNVDMSGVERAGDVITITGEYVWNIASLTFADNVEVWAEDFLVNTRYEVQVAVPLAARTGAVTYYDGNANEVQTELGELTLREAVVTGIDNDSPELGSEIVISGTDLDLIGCANFPYVDSVEVMVNEAATELRCIVPKNTTPGDINFAQYSTLNVKVPITPLMIEVTDVAPAENLEVGDVVTITGTRLDRAQYISLPGGIALAPDEYSATDTQITFTVPEGMSDGAVTIVQHENYSVTTDRIAMLHEGSINVIWSGDWECGSWNGWDNLAWGKYDWSTVSAGTELVISYKLDEAETYWQMRVGDGNWSALPGTEDPYDLAGTNELRITLTEEMLSVLNNSGLVLTGCYYILNSVGLSVPEQVIWGEGSWVCDGWNGNSDLAWGGFDWSTVSAGSTLVISFELNASADYWQMRVGDGNWSALPDTQDPYDLTDLDTLYITITQDMLDVLNESGMVLTGHGYTLKKVSIQ